MKLVFNTHISIYEQGKIYDVDDDEAKKLVGNGYAEVVKETKGKK